MSKEMPVKLQIKKLIRIHTITCILYYAILTLQKCQAVWAQTFSSVRDVIFVQPALLLDSE